jgi:hypothetical protein
LSGNFKSGLPDKSGEGNKHKEAAMKSIAVMLACALAAAVSGCAGSPGTAGDAHSGESPSELSPGEAAERPAPDPADAAAYYNRGIAYYYKGDLDRAIADYT